MKEQHSPRLEPLLSLSRRVGMTRHHLMKIVNDGRIECVKIGRLFYFPEGSWESFVERESARKPRKFQPHESDRRPAEVA
jgi:hypothetical protein